MILEILTFVGTTGFVAYKLYVGYFYVDLSLSLSSSRSHSIGDVSILVITAKLKKGPQGSIRIHDMQAKVSCDGHVQFTPFVGFHRMSYCTAPLGDEDDRRLVDWSVTSGSAPLLRLPPGEEAEFSCFVRIPKDAVCIIEAAVIGRERRHFSGVGQWKASQVSVPPSLSPKA